MNNLEFFLESLLVEAKAFCRLLLLKFSRIFKSTPPQTLFFAYFLLLLSSAYLFFGSAKALENEDSFINLELELGDYLGRPISGTGRIVLEAPDGHNSLCLWLPGQERKQLDYPALFRRFGAFASEPEPLHLPLRFKTDMGDLNHKFLSKSVVKIESKDPSVPLKFELNFSIRKEIRSLKAQSSYVWERFYPHPVSCDHLSPNEPKFETIRTQATIKVKNENWKVIAPSHLNDPKGLQTNEISFVVIPTNSTSRLSKNGAIRFHYIGSTNQTPSEDTIESSYDFMVQNIGPPPLDSLDVIQTNNIERIDLPGIVLLNNPKQGFASEIQTKWLNWSHWAAVSMISAQWFGVSVRTELRDAWILEGIRDYLALLYLKTHSERFNLFNVFEKQLFNLSLNYRQSQDLFGSIMRTKPDSAQMVNSKLQTILQYKLQSTLAGARQVLALRQIADSLGEQYLLQFLGRIYTRKGGSHIDPKFFHDAILRREFGYPRKLGKRGTVYLRHWWMSEDWPDISLDSFDVEQIGPGQFITKIKVKHSGSFRFPVDVQVRDDKNNKSTLTVGFDDEGFSTAEIKTKTKTTSVLIDPNRKIFDSNRYNNTSQWPKFAFLPGSARNLADDGFTVLWVPMVIKKPGTDWALAIRSTISRYVHDRMYLLVKRQFTKGPVAYQFEYEKEIFMPRLAAKIRSSQDFFERRIAQLGVTYPIKFFGFLATDTEFSTRYRQNGNSSATLHQTGFGSLKLGLDLGRDWLGISAGYVSEATLPFVGENISYRRNQSFGSISFQLFDELTIANRYFDGKISNGTEVPSSALFRPQESTEAGLRIDISDLDFVEDIWSLKTDVYFPFLIPLPNASILLARNAKWHVFHDIGYSSSIETNYRSYGLGSTIPLGGDMMGVGSVSMAQIDIYAILNSTVGERESNVTKWQLEISGKF